MSTSRLFFMILVSSAFLVGGLNLGGRIIEQKDKMVAHISAYNSY